MAKTATERQAAYRARHFKQGVDHERINMVVSLTAAMALRRLAAHWGTSQRQAFERLMAEAQEKAQAGMSSDELARYFDAVSSAA